jgi:hypothetical protein
MVEEVVVRDILSDEMIQAGAEVVQQLDRSDFPIEAALWLYLPDSQQWRLMLASPEVKIHGPKKGYKQIQSALTQLAPRLSLQNVTLVDSTDPLILLLKKTLKTDGGTGVRFRGNTVNGVFIEDAYIYRLS